LEDAVARIAAEGPNAQQIEYWNEVSGARWVEMNHVIDAQIAPLGEAAMERAAPVSGERVLDVGCGCGQTSLQLAERVGADGQVVGIDISAVMLERARERAKQAGLSNLEFRNVDAQIEPFESSFDLLFSRFGVMFFASPEEALANLLSVLRPGGRLTFLTWQPLAANPWMHVPLAAAAKHLPPTGPPPDPTAPGPFAFADSARVERILAGAGFEDVAHESLERELLIGGGKTLDETVSFMLQVGPVAGALREADDDVRARVLPEVRKAIEPFYDESGVRMSASTWIVSARRPA
jgi:SAM-dependent methyltransferase